MPDTLLKNIRGILFYIATILLLAQCAIVVKPTGGPKDTTPPKVLSYAPENKSTGFNSQKIKITFDEYFQLKDLNKQLIVSPPLKHQPQILIKGKTLEITLKDTLKNNSTYTFNFGNAIVDNNEGNVLKGFQYIVSTGDHIDSLTVTGHVQDAFTHDPVKQGYVELYTDQSDSAIYKYPPAYIALTDDAGNYQINNINEGTYKTIAIGKPQTDYLYHPYIESIGFKSRLTEIHSHDTTNLNVFTEQPVTLHLIKTKVIDRGEIMMVFNKPVSNLTIKHLNLSDSLVPKYTFINLSVTSDTTFYWLNTPFIDSLRLIAFNNNVAIDTAFVHSFPNNTAARKVKKPKPLKLKITSNAHNGFDYHQPINLQFGNPVLKYNTDKIHLVLRKDTIKFTADTSILPLGFNLLPASPLISDSTYTLTLLPGAFTNMFGIRNDTIKLKFSVQEPTYFGTLKLDVKIEKQGHYLLQMLDAKNNVYRQFAITGSASKFFDALSPATYRLRVIDDANNNGQWDGGDYLNSIQPEKVYYYPESINIRSNWDLTQTWIVK